MIELHFDRTPNCWKVAIMLEEIGMPYRIVKYDLYKGEHLMPAYRRLNPNVKLPAMIDHEPADGGAPFPVAETGAMLIYLAEKSGRFLPQSARERAPVLQWVAWQISGLGPMVGQASHFIRYANEPHDYSINRFRNESRRLMEVLDGQLGRTEYVAGDYSIADMAIWPWSNFVEPVGIGLKLDEFPNVQRWGQLIAERPAVKRVFANPETAVDQTYLKTQRKLSEEEWSNLFGDRMLAAARA